MIIPETLFVIIMTIGVLIAITAITAILELIGTYTLTLKSLMKTIIILILSITPMIYYIKADLPEFIAQKDYELTKMNTCIAVIMEENETFINLTKKTGRTDISPETHVYREFISKGVKHGINWSERKKYEVVEKTK